LLRQVAPKASRIAVFLYPNPTSYRQLKIAQDAARALGMTVVPVEIKGPEVEDFERGIAALEKHPPSAALMIAEPTLSTHRRRIVAFAIKHRIPAIGTVRPWAEQGLLLSYGTNFNDLWRRVAGHVDKILKGARAGDLPVEQPTKFELVVNQRTAKAIGVKVPSALLLRADLVIE
jgi:putative ABC transport system substrate-binding protein